MTSAFTIRGCPACGSPLRIQMAEWEVDRGGLKVTVDYVCQAGCEVRVESYDSAFHSEVRAELDEPDKRAVKRRGAIRPAEPKVEAGGELPEWPRDDE